MILETAGIPVTRTLAREIWELAIAVPKQFTPFEDTLPALTTLRDRSYRLGIITNLRGDLAPLVDRAGIGSYLDFCVNSTLVGKEKPHPPIFEEALRRAEWALAKCSISATRCGLMSLERGLWGCMPRCWTGAAGTSRSTVLPRSQASAKSLASSSRRAGISPD